MTYTLSLLAPGSYDGLRNGVISSELVLYHLAVGPSR